jgi:hypothetical protein
LFQVAAKANPVSHVQHGASNSEAIDRDLDLPETQTNIGTIPTIRHGSHDGLQEHGLGGQSDIDIDPFEEDDISHRQEEEVTELARIIEDIENGVVDPTLATLGEDDVLLDMDDILVFQDDDWSDSSSEGTVDGE